MLSFEMCVDIFFIHSDLLLLYYMEYVNGKVTFCCFFSELFLLLRLIP